MLIGEPARFAGIELFERPRENLLEAPCLNSKLDERPFRIFRRGFLNILGGH